MIKLLVLTGLLSVSVAQAGAFYCESSDKKIVLKTEYRGNLATATLTEGSQITSFNGIWQAEFDGFYNVYEYDLADQDGGPAFLQVVKKEFISRGGGCRGRACLVDENITITKAKLQYQDQVIHFVCQ